MTEADIPGLSDDALAALAKSLRFQANLASATNLADLDVARYEPPSEAVDRVLDRNLDRMTRITRWQRLVREEQERRA